MKPAGRYRLLLIMCLVAAGVIYSPSLHYPFIWDDIKVVRDNAYLRAPPTLFLFFQPHFWKQMLPISRIDYRPLQMLALRMIALGGGDHPLPFRLTNILLHLLVCLLIWYLVKHFSSKGRLGLLTAAFFALHPVHVETVVNARNISELLSTAFMLLAFLLFLKCSSARSLFLSSFVFLLAVLCKESSLIFPLLLVAFILIMGRKETRSLRLRWTIPFWLIALAGAVGKIVIASGGSSQAPPTLIQYIMAAAKLLMVYLRLLIFPVWLRVLYPFFKPTSWTRPEWFFSLLAVLTLLGIGWHFLKNDRLPFWAFSSLVISLLPLLIKIGQIGRMVAEQRLYFPSVFFCLLLAFFFDKMAMYPRRSFFLLTAFSAFLLCLVYAGLTGEYLTGWRSDLALWTRVTILSPRSALAHNNLAIVFHRQGDDRRSRRELRAALRIQPHHKEAHNNLGVLHRQCGRYEEAITEFKKSLKANPDYYPASLNLAEVYLQMRQLKKAEKTIRGVLERNPYLPQAYNGLAIALERRGEYAQAKAAYLKAAELNPEYAVSLRNLTGFLQEAGDYEEAIKVGQEAIRRQPGNPDGYLALTRVYVSRGEFEKARALLQRALSFAPQNWQVKSQLWALESDRPAYRQE